MARSMTMGILGALVVAMTACTTAPQSDGGDDNSGSDYAGTAPTGDTGSDTGDGTGDDGAGSGSGTPDTMPQQTSDTTSAQSPTIETGCTAYGSDIYTPYVNYGPVSTGNVSTFPWRGHAESYPDTVEDFRSYAPGSTVECGSNKNTRDYLDVTAGCLTAASDGGTVGQIHTTSDGYYRSFALPYDEQTGRQAAWTDQGVEYKFKYSSWTGDVSNPGFKAFARYMTEYDLYVGSWRRDGVVQIQKKHGGVYTILKRNPNFGPPAPDVWHTIRFEAVGNEQRLYLDGQLAMTTTDDTIKRGTAGIRIDDADGAHIDDWRVYAP